MGNQTSSPTQSYGGSSDSVASFDHHSASSSGTLTPPETSPVKGQVLFNKYEIKDILLGEGGFAKVKKGKCLQSGTAVAIKIMKNEESETDIQQRVGVKQERKIHSILSHPNIVRLLDFYLIENTVFFVQEFVPGGDLQEHLSEIPNHSLEEDKAARLFCQLAGALDYLHELKIVHRDIKLENILLDESKTLAKLTDFGFADFVDFSERFVDSCGTIEYVPPEVVYRRPSPDRRKMDVWALGVVLYCMLYGRPPFYGNDHKELFRKVLNVEVAFLGPRRAFVSPEANDLLKRMLTKNVVHRPAMKEVLNHQWVQLYRPRLNASLNNSIPRTPRYMGYPLKGHSPNKKGTSVSPNRHVRGPLSPLRTLHKKLVNPGSPASGSSSPKNSPLSGAKSSNATPPKSYGGNTKPSSINRTTPISATSSSETSRPTPTHASPLTRTPIQDSIPRTTNLTNSPLSPSVTYCKNKPRQETPIPPSPLRQSQKENTEQKVTIKQDVPIKELNGNTYEKLQEPQDDDEYEDIPEEKENVTQKPNVPCRPRNSPVSASKAQAIKRVVIVSKGGTPVQAFRKKTPLRYGQVVPLKQSPIIQLRKQNTNDIIESNIQTSAVRKLDF